MRKVRAVWYGALFALLTTGTAAQPADSPAVLLALARQYAEAGQLDRAITSYERSLAAINDSTGGSPWKGQEPIIRFNLAMLHAAKGADFFQAENLGDAISSFRTSLQWNPYSRDIRYNLCQALYVQAARLKEEGAGPGELTPLYADVIAEAGKVREADPANANLLRLLGYSHRALGDEERAAALFAETANFEFEVSDVRMQVENAETNLTGVVKNLRLAPGAPLRMRVTILALSGEAMASSDVEVPAPRVNEGATFAVKIKTTEDIAGWRYEMSRK
jgi:tetratricopeptide (TPR) repeat protein